MRVQINFYLISDFFCASQNPIFRLLKPHIHDKHHYGMGNSRALFRSEICLRANSPISPCQYVNKALTSAYEKYGFSLVHTQRCTANPHAPIKMAMRPHVMCAVIVTYQRFICMYNCGTTGFPYTDDVNKTCYDNAS